jgi:extradiol dioxygenase family protein
MVKGIYGTMYYVANMKQAVEFYRDTLGIKPTSESPEWAEYDLKGAKLCLHATKPEGNYPLNGILIFNTDKVKAHFEELKSQGLNVFGLHEVQPGTWTFHLRDHNGNEHSFYGAP